jgi:transcription elongation factor GreA
MGGVQKMQNSSELSQDAFETLRQHLAHLQTGKHKVIEEYFDERTGECIEFEELLNVYISQIDQMVRNSKPTKTKDSGLPFVIIGSSVEVQDVDNGESFRFKVVPPYQGSAKSRDICDVSCLSPVGKSLLLKCVGEKVEVAAPGGVFCYKIKSIRFP